MTAEAILAQTSHRPWPLPALPWAMTMRWCDLAFLHWPVRPDVLRPLIPAALDIDTFDGMAWIGVVPFRMERVRLRLAPPIPTTSAFPELNLRTYVRSAGRAGVWFFSLDAASSLAVRSARTVTHLPYFEATMGVSREGSDVRYESRRTHSGAPPAEFKATYRPDGQVYRADKGTLDHWLVERYCLFAAGRHGRISSIDVHHAPWPLQRGTAEIQVNTMAAAAGIQLPSSSPVVHFAARQEVLAWLPAALPVSEVIEG